MGTSATRTCNFLDNKLNCTRLQLMSQKLFGRLSSGRSAELAGLSRVEFLNVLGKYQVFPIESELNDLESCYA